MAVVVPLARNRFTSRAYRCCACISHSFSQHERSGRQAAEKAAHLCGVRVLVGFLGGEGVLAKPLHEGNI